MLNRTPVSLVRCQLETGRTHQIRVHMQSAGYPLVGDAVYGKQHLASAFARQALHACRLGLNHPRSGKPKAWTAPLPQDMRDLLASAGIAEPEL
jgi:23S rRNA pseudouridine1911/1915/1917 synthase